MTTTVGCPGSWSVSVSTRPCTGFTPIVSKYRDPTLRNVTVWERSPGDSRFSIELTEGVHQIEIRKEGYGSYARTIDVYRGRVSTLNVGLTPRGAVQKPTSTVVVKQR